MDKLTVAALISVVFVISLIASCGEWASLTKNSQFTPGPQPWALQIEPKAMTESNGFYNVYVTINATAPDTINKLQLNEDIAGLETYVNGTMVNAAGPLGVRLSSGDVIGVNFTMPYTEYSSVNEVTVYSADATYGTWLPASYQPHLVTDLGWYMHNNTDPVANIANKFTVYGDIRNDGATDAQNCTLTVKFYDNQQLLQTSEVPLGEIKGFDGYTYLNSTNIPCSAADSVTNTTINLTADNVPTQ